MFSASTSIFLVFACSTGNGHEVSTDTTSKQQKTLILALNIISPGGGGDGGGGVCTLASTCKPGSQVPIIPFAGRKAA